jgi:hypothetical protein
MVLAIRNVASQHILMVLSEHLDYYSQLSEDFKGPKSYNYTRTYRDKLLQNMQFEVSILNIDLYGKINKYLIRNVHP